MYRKRRIFKFVSANSNSMIWYRNKFMLMFYLLSIFVIILTIKSYNVFFCNLSKNIFGRKEVWIDKWISSSANLTWIDQNPIYSKYNITTATPLKRVTIIVVITSAPSRGDRRQAIRDTFWKECIPIKSVIPECIFMTDNLEPNERYYNETQTEVKKYGDLKFQSSSSGVYFGERLLYHMFYAMKHYEFDYFLRMDDDYFLCLNNLLQELPIPMYHYLSWGWCHIYLNMRPDEAMILFSKDVIVSFLQQDVNKMKCHPIGDQLVATWALELNFRDFFRHDPRLHHSPIVPKQPRLLKHKNVCSKYIGIHGSYPKEMRTLYSHRGPLIETTKTILDHSKVMKSNNFHDFDWKRFRSPWRYEPKLCISNPTWETPLLLGKNGEFKGREKKVKHKL